MRLNRTQNGQYFSQWQQITRNIHGTFFSQGCVGGPQWWPRAEAVQAWCVQKGEGRMLVFTAAACDLQQRSHCCVDFKENSLPHIHTQQGTAGQMKIIYKDIKSSLSCFWKLNLNTACVCVCFPASGHVIDLSEYHSDCLRFVFFLRSDHQC